MHEAATNYRYHNWLLNDNLINSHEFSSENCVRFQSHGNSFSAQTQHAIQHGINLCQKSRFHSCPKPFPIQVFYSKWELSWRVKPWSKFNTVASWFLESSHYLKITARRAFVKTKNRKRKHFVLLLYSDNCIL